MRIVLVGCGGTGMEILKLIRNESNELLLVDYDRIILSNLHILSMFSRDDIGRYKSQRAAEIMNVMNRNTIKFLVQKIEDVPINVLNQYDIVIGALDNVEGRMNLNLMFRQSTCSLLIDCGVSGYKAHAKAVYKESSCLYCIKELYMNENDPNICSLRSIPERITSDNRGNVLKCMIELERGKCGSKALKVERIVNRFNELVEDVD